MAENDIIAVIDIGSSAIRLLVAQRDALDWKLLENAELPLALGKDVFQRGYIERNTISRTVEILKKFQELMSPYGADRIAAIGTSALREAENREMFIDRVYLQTGIKVQILDGLEVNQLTWLAVRKPLQEAVKDLKHHDSLIIEVGAGNTDIMLLKKGHVATAQALPLGTLRFLQHLEKRIGRDGGNLNNYFHRHTSRIIKAMSYELELEQVTKLIAIGGDARLVAARLGTPLTDKITVISRNKFRNFMSEIEALSLEDITAKLNLPWSEAELLYPSLIIFNTFLESTKTRELLVPLATIRHGLLISYAADTDSLRELFRPQVLAGAKRLAEHYRTDMEHCQFVREQAVVLFDFLAEELGLKNQHKLFLEAAALLHDVGSFIGGTGHHKHSQYIVQNSEIFGLSISDREIVGNIVRYHRRATPQRSHQSFMKLARTDRLIVQKLAAILRVADALDRSHTQSISISEMKITRNKLILVTPQSGNLPIETISLTEKGDLFEDLFGLKPVLQWSEE